MGIFVIILCAIPLYLAEDAAVENMMDDAVQDDVYYYIDDAYYVDETDNTDDTNNEYTFYINNIEDEDNCIANKHVSSVIDDV